MLLHQHMAMLASRSLPNRHSLRKTIRLCGKILVLFIFSLKITLPWILSFLNLLLTTLPTVWLNDAEWDLDTAQKPPA